MRRPYSSLQTTELHSEFYPIELRWRKLVSIMSKKSSVCTAWPIPMSLFYVVIVSSFDSDCTATSSCLTFYVLSYLSSSFIISYVFWAFRVFKRRYSNSCFRRISSSKSLRSLLSHRYSLNMSFLSSSGIMSCPMTSTRGAFGFLGAFGGSNKG